MKTAEGMDKPLAEWRLNELKDFCQKMCNEPKSYVPCRDCSILNYNLCKYSPNKWILNEKPKFTEQEVQDAKAIMRIWGRTDIDIIRNKNGHIVIVLCRAIGNTNGFFVNKDLFPSIRNEERFNVLDITGEEEVNQCSL